MSQFYSLSIIKQIAVANRTRNFILNDLDIFKGNSFQYFYLINKYLYSFFHNISPEIIIQSTIKMIILFSHFFSTNYNL